MQSSKKNRLSKFCDNCTPEFPQRTPAKNNLIDLNTYSDWDFHSNLQVVVSDELAENLLPTPLSQIPFHFSSISKLLTKTTSEINSERCQELPIQRNSSGKIENGTEFAEMSKKNSSRFCDNYFSQLIGEITSN